MQLYYEHVISNVCRVAEFIVDNYVFYIPSLYPGCTVAFHVVIAVQCNIT